MSNYQSFELTQGAVLDLVEATCRHLTDKGHFTEQSAVKAADVNKFIDQAYYWLIGQLARYGYSISVTVDRVKGVVQELQALDACVQVESAVPVSSTGEENSRYKGLAYRRDKMVESLLGTDALEQLGHTRERGKSTNLEGTGRSRDRKDVVYTNSDVIQSRFKRGQGQTNTVADLRDPNQV